MIPMMAVKQVTLTERHLRPGRTKHTLIDGSGSRPFPEFVKLVITTDPNEPTSGFYLMHICADGTGTDTWHQTIEDAFYQAGWEFEVKPEEWQDIDEPF